jgi:DNA invertase Pin-like site-specific DNA recombinase
VIYTRYSTRHPHSTEDQVRACREWAERNNIEVIAVFSDEGKSGRKSRRPGLKQALQHLEDGSADTLIAYSVNRLFRKVLAAQQFIQDYIEERGKSVAFVRENVDTDKAKDWRVSLGFHNVMDEAQLTMYVGNIQEAHKSLAAKSLVHGTLPFGYMGVPVEGRPTRRERTRCAIRINPELAPHVVSIFTWFTEDGLGYKQIACKLQAEGVPPPPKTEMWSRLIIRRILRNRRYIGDWSYGVSKSIWKHKADYNSQKLRDQPLQEMHDPSLAIISNEMFAKARERASRLPNVGRTRKNLSGEVIPHPLKGLLFCPIHNLTLHSAGSDGRWLECSGYKRVGDESCLYSIANADIALGQICKHILTQLRQRPDLVNTIVAQAKERLDRYEPPSEVQAEAVREELLNVRHRMTVAVRMLKRGDDESVLEELRSRRDALEAELLAAEKHATADPSPSGQHERRNCLVNIL